MEQVSSFFKVENDIFYKVGEEKGIKIGEEKGFKKGEENKSYKFVYNLLLANKFTVAEISNFVDVPEDFVIKVKQGMNSK